MLFMPGIEYCCKNDPPILLEGSVMKGKYNPKGKWIENYINLRLKHVKVGQPKCFIHILFHYSAGPLILGYYKFELNTANDGASAKPSPFHALIFLGKNDCPYWLVVLPICLNFILCFLLVPLYASTRTHSNGTCAKQLIICKTE